jgi:RND family efflux transporter MFP subunit
MKRAEALGRVAVTLVLAFTAAAAPACKKKQAALPPAQGPGAPPPPELPTVVQPGDESSTVAASEGHTTGTTYPRAEAQVGPNASGIIDKIYVAEGARVRRGQVLARLDSRDAALRVEQARAALEAARVNLRATETEHNRTKMMFDEKAATQMQLDQLVARLDAAKVGVQQAQVALSMAQKALSDATVRSPINGVVTAKLKNEGEMATTMPPTVVLVVQDQSVLELRFRLSERSLAEVKLGDTVTARFEAINRTEKAKVTRIQAAVDPRTRTIEVVAELPNPGGQLRSGLLAEVTLGDAAKAATAPADTATPRAGRPAPKPGSQPEANAR